MSRHFSLGFDRARFLPCSFIFTMVLFASPVRAQNPVLDLQQTLPLVGEAQLTNPPEAVVAFRQEDLRRKVEALKTIADLRRALVLKEWNLDPTARINDRMRSIDAAMRKKVGDRFLAQIRHVIASGDSASRLAAANMIAEMGANVRSLDPDSRASLGRMLTPEVIKLAKDESLAVRQEGLRALGNINALPADAIPVFLAVLKGDEVGPRRLTAESLGQMMRVASHLNRSSQTSSGVTVTREELVKLSIEIVKAVATGLQDSDLAVRQSCLETLSESARTVSDLIAKPRARKEYPPDGRPLSDFERENITRDTKSIRDELQEMQPLLLAFRSNNTEILRSLADPNPALKSASLQALDNIGNMRTSLRRLILSVPVLVKDKQTDNANLSFLLANDPLEPFFQGDAWREVASMTKHADLRVRRGALGFLGWMEEKAEVALAELTQAFDDRDRMIRWSALKAVDQLHPAKAESAVPAVVRLLQDNDVAVKLLAAQTLENFGENGKAAVAGLARALTTGDSDFRIAVMNALQAIPAEHSSVAIPQLIEALKNVDPTVRRTAADTLGSFGNRAESAVATLRMLIGDDDVDVRSSASDAILSIRQSAAPAVPK